MFVHRTAYAPVVHCGSVRQAARVLQMTELCPSSSPDARELEGCHLAPAVASAAALLCSPSAGATFYRLPPYLNRTLHICRHADVMNASLRLLMVLDRCCEAGLADDRKADICLD